MFGSMFNNNQQQSPQMMGGIGGFQQPYAYPQNNGITFGNVVPPKQSSSTPEEMALIKNSKQEAFTVTPEELAKFAWDNRENNNLVLEVENPDEELMRKKYTGETFHILIQDVSVLQAHLDIIRDFVETTKTLNTTSDPAMLRQLYLSAGIVNKLLPKAYEVAKNNYSTATNQMANALNGTVGYQGNWGNPMWNGAIGAVPNYIINESGMNMQPSVNNMMMYQAATAQYQQPMMQQPMMPMQNNSVFSSSAPMPTGGTMLNNPFMQQQPQQYVPNVPNQMMPNMMNNMNQPVQPQVPTTPQQPVQPTATTPTMTNMPNIPMPGSLGNTNNNTTTNNNNTIKI